MSEQPIYTGGTPTAGYRKRSLLDRIMTESPLGIAVSTAGRGLMEGLGLATQGSPRVGLAQGMVAQAAQRAGADAATAQGVGEQAVANNPAVQKALSANPSTGGAGLIGYPMAAADTAWSYGVARPAATGLLLTDKTPGDSLPERVRNAWNRSEGVSFGRAFAASPINNAPVPMNVAGLIVTLGGLDKYDPWSDYDMAQAGENPFYNFVTGSADAALAIAVPPMAKIGRLNALNKVGLRSRVQSADDLLRLRADYEAHRLGRNPMAAPEGSAASEPTTWGMYIDSLAEETNPAKIKANPLIANATGADKDELARIIAQTSDPDTVNEIALANLGDVEALRRLSAAAPDHVWALSDLNSTIRNAAVNGTDFRPRGEALQRVNQTFDSALARDHYFSDLRSLFATEEGFARAGSTWMPSQRMLVERIRMKGGEVRYAVRTGDLSGAPGWVSRRFDAGGASPVSVFVQWTGSRQPLGTVSMSGARPGDLADEFDAMMNSVPIFRGNRPIVVGRRPLEGGTGIEDIAVPANQWRAEALSRLIEARSSGNVKQAWEQIEDEATRIMADTLGVDRRFAADFVRGNRAKAAETLGYLQESGGYLFDEMGARVIVDPVTRRQLLDSFVTLDMSTIYDDMLREYNTFIKAGIDTRDVATWAFDAGQKVFRTNVLFRPGYTGKNSIAEPMLSSWLAHGTILTDEGLAATLGNFAANRANTLKRVAYLTELNTLIKRVVKREPAKTRRQIRKEINELVRQRHDTEAVRDGLLAELDDIKAGRVPPSVALSNRDEVIGRLQEAQGRLDAIEASLDGRIPEWRQVVEPATLSDVRAKLREYRAIVGDDTGYVDDLNAEIDLIIDNAARSGRRDFTAVEERRIANLESAIARVKNGANDPDDLRGKIEQLQALYDDALAASREPMRDPTPQIEALAKEISAYDRKIGSLQVDLGESRKRLSEVSGGRGFRGTGQDYSTLFVGGEKFRVPAAFSDRQYDFGPGYRAEASAAQTSRLTYDPSYRAAHEIARWKRSATPVQIDPTDPTYWDELAYVANAHLRGDKLVQRILEGQSRADIAAWLASTEGRAYQKSMGRKYLVPKETYSDPVRPLAVVDGQKQPDRIRRVLLESTTELDEVMRLVNQYFPDERARSLIATREVTAGDLQRMMGKRTDLSRISGEDLIYDPSNKGSALLGRLNNAADRIWQFIATMPEDRLARWPFYQREWRYQMERRAEILRGQGVTMTPGQFNAMRQEAHRAALTELEKTFYNIRRYNTPVYLSRFLLSFPGAFFNSFYRYGRFAAKEPERVLQSAVIANNIIENMGVDENGNRVDSIKDAAYLLIPGTKRHAGDAGFRIPIQSAMSLTINYPSLSYLGTYAVATAAKQNPKTEDIIRSAIGEVAFDELFPYGFNRNPGSAFFSSYQKDLWRAAQGESDTDFLQMAVQFYADGIAQAEKNGTEPPTYEEALQQTRDFLLVRGGIKFVNAFSTKRDVPGQLMRDSWYALREQYPGDPAGARRIFMEQFGDWARWYTYSSSDYSAFVPSTTAAYDRLWVNHPDLTRSLVSLAGSNADMMSMVSLLTVGTDGPFSQSVANFLRDNPLPGDDVPVITKMPVEQFDNMVRVNDGWATYTRDKAKYTAETERLRLLRDGAPTQAQRDHYSEWLESTQASWQEYVSQLKVDNPPWGLDYDQPAGERSKQAVTFLQKILDDKKFMRTDGRQQVWQDLKAFMPERVKALAAVENVDTMSLTADEKAEYKRNIKQSFYDWVDETFASKTPEFAGVWERYFAKEWTVD